MSNNLEIWKPIVGESWYYNNEELFNSEYSNDLLSTLMHHYKTTNVFPEMKNVFKAFRLTTFSDVRVVILGDKPYEGLQNGKPIATGLAFAHDAESPYTNSSLNNIFRVIEKDCYNGLRVNYDFSLEEWVKQGVLLINESLTFNEFTGPNYKLFEDFICEIFRNLNSKLTGVHFVFVGERAKKFSKFINPKIHYRYAVEDPSTFKTVGKDWKCDVFKKISDMSVEQNGEEFRIIW